MKQARYKEPLPLAVIKAARAGDAGAVEQVLQYYNGYINKLCTRTLYDDCGQLHVPLLHDGFGNLRSLQVTGDGRAFLGGVQHPCCFQEDPAGRSEKTALTDESDLRDAYPHRCSVLRFQERRLQRPAGPAPPFVNRIS